MFGSQYVRNFVHTRKLKISDILRYEHIVILAYGEATIKIADNCLPKALFIVHNFKPRPVLEFGLLLTQHVYMTAFFGSMCANVLYPDETDQANDYNKVIIDRLIQSVQTFLKDWFNDLLDSTWSVIEPKIVTNTIHSHAAGRNIYLTEQNIGKLTDEIASSLSKIGNPKYQRSVILLKAIPINTYYVSPQEMTFKCVPNAYFEARYKGVSVYVIKRDFSKVAHYLTEYEMKQYIGGAAPIFKTVMERKYRKYQSPALVVDLMAKHDNLDLNLLKQYRCYFLIKSFADLTNSCGFLVGNKSTIPDVSVEGVCVHNYIPDGSLEKWCTEWRLILA